MLNLDNMFWEFSNNEIVAVEDASNGVLIYSLIFHGIKNRIKFSGVICAVHGEDLCKAKILYIQRAEIEDIPDHIRKMLSEKVTGTGISADLNKYMHENRCCIYMIMAGQEKMLSCIAAKNMVCELNG